MSQLIEEEQNQGVISLFLLHVLSQHFEKLLRGEEGRRGGRGGRVERGKGNEGLLWSVEEVENGRERRRGKGGNL